MSETTVADDRTKSPSDLVCFCFNISREAVLAHVRRPGSSYETLLKETGIGTKCTACRMNLEILLGDQVNFESAQHTVAGKRSRWTILSDQLNCGFFFARQDMHTVLRFANPEFPLNAEASLVPHDWRLKVFGEEGDLVHETKGLLEVGGAVTIDFSEMAGIPSFGWFTIDMVARGKGFIGNIRPQSLLRGRGWAVPYHGQLTMYASKRRKVMVPTGEGRYSTLFPVINVDSRINTVTISVDGISAGFEDQAAIAIPPYGARLIDLDSIFRQPVPGQLAVALVTSTQPARHFVMHRQATGSYSVDHFPNTR